MSATAARAPSATRSADRRRRHLHVVRERPHRHVVLFGALYLLVGVAIVFGAVSLNALVAADAVAERNLANQVATAERDYERLVAQVARLEDPARIAAVAAELGLVPNGVPRFLAPGRGLPADVAAPAPTTDGMKTLLTADGQ